MCAVSAVLSCAAAEKIRAVYGEVWLPDKRDHIQGICATAEAIYFGCNRTVIKLDWNGREITRVSAPDHTGDICTANGKIYSAVGYYVDANRKIRKGYIIEYSPDLVELKRNKLDIPIDGLAELDGFFYCGVGGAGKKYHRVNKVAKIPVKFDKKPEIFDVDCGHETMYGPQAICSDGKQIFMSYYARYDLSSVHNKDMSLAGVLDFSACLGFEPVPGKESVFMRLIVTKENKTAPRLQAFRIDFFKYENGKMVNITKYNKTGNVSK